MSRSPSLASNNGEAVPAKPVKPTTVKSGSTVNGGGRAVGRSGSTYSSSNGDNGSGSGVKGSINPVLALTHHVRSDDLEKGPSASTLMI